MNIDKTRIFKVLEASSGRIEETTPKPAVNGNLNLDEKLLPYPRDKYGNPTVDPQRYDKALTEAAVGQLSTANFPDLLRMGVQFDVFGSFAETPITYPQFVNVINSNKQQEEYLKDAGIGMAPVVAEGADYPQAAVNLADGVIIRNSKRGYIIPVTEEMQRFDQLGKVRDLSNQVGRGLRLTEEQDAYDVLTTAANYTRNSTTGDNNEGANTQTLTFDAQGLIVAFNVLRTMKDRTSGQYLGVNPNLLIVTPNLWWYVQQLIASPQLARAHGNTSSEIIGTGTTNAFFNVVSTIIVSPHLGTEYEWCLMEAGRAITFQRVTGVEILIEGQNAQTSGYFERDVIRYRGRVWFGVGMKDDRFAFFSDSTTIPTIS